MATMAGINRGISSSSSSSWGQLKSSQKKKLIGGSVGRRFEIRCVAGSDPYKTLRIRPGASESEVKKAFRRLALQYHPDVCRGRNCGTKFQKINEAYDTVMSNLRSIRSLPTYPKVETDYSGETFNPESMGDEWMGYEAAGMFREFHDYSGAEYQ